jgi:hypothetical protein
MIVRKVREGEEGAGSKKEVTLLWFACYIYVSMICKREGRGEEGMQIAPVVHEID